MIYEGTKKDLFFIYPKVQGIGNLNIFFKKTFAATLFSYETIVGNKLEYEFVYLTSEVISVLGPALWLSSALR